MIGIDRLIHDFRDLGWKVDGPIQSGGMPWAIVHDYEIPAGRFRGQVVQVAIPAPADFPATPPGGLYVGLLTVPPDQMGTIAVHDRSNETGALPGAWQYWSRPIPPGTWQTQRAVRRLLNHWNSVMANVN